MVSLKKIDNPFSEEMMNSLEGFIYENNFYDCINKELLYFSDVLYNIRYSFHTYLLVGDFDTWIGYVLFYNKNTVEKFKNDPNSLEDSDFLEYDLDIAIRIPNINCDIEDEYSGFIKETYDRVNDLLINDFNNVKVNFNSGNQKILKMSV